MDNLQIKLNKTGKEPVQPLFEEGYNYQVIINPVYDNIPRYEIGILKGTRFRILLGNSEEANQNEFLMSQNQYVKLYSYDNFDIAIDRAMHLLKQLIITYYDMNWLTDTILVLEVPKWKIVKCDENGSLICHYWYIM